MRVDVATGEIPLVLRLMDHQLIGSEGELLGNVDELVLREDDDGLAVTALMTGPAALAGRQGGRAGSWLRAIWVRLHPDSEPVPLAIPLSHVTKLDSAVHLSAVASKVLAESDGWELWLRQHVVSRLPGALGGGSETPGSLPLHRHRHPEFAVDPDARRLSQLAGAQVVLAGGRTVGTVIEVAAEATARTGLELGELRVTQLVSSRRHLGSELGYTMAPQGPRLVRWLVTWWHRGDQRVRIEDVARVDWDAGRVLLVDQPDLRHPHDHSS